MLQSCGQAYFAEKTLGAGRAQLGSQNLQGDESIMSNVAREVDGRHTSAPELTLERVATPQGIDKGWRCRHRCRSPVVP